MALYFIEISLVSLKKMHFNKKMKILKDNIIKTDLIFFSQTY